MIWLPYNDTTQTIFYDQRIILSQARQIPVVWKVTKVEDMNVKGIARYTLAQDMFDAHKDYIEKDESGNVIGMWADYYTDGIPIINPDMNPIKPSIYSSISYSGSKPEIKIGGNFKTFTVRFYDELGEIEFHDGHWNFIVNDDDASSLIDTSPGADINQIRVKFTGDDSYTGQNMNVSFISDDGIKSDININIVGL